MMDRFIGMFVLWFTAGAACACHTFSAWRRRDDFKHVCKTRCWENNDVQADLSVVHPPHPHTCTHARSLSLSLVVAMLKKNALISPHKGVNSRWKDVTQAQQQRYCLNICICGTARRKCKREGGKLDSSNNNASNTLLMMVAVIIQVSQCTPHTNLYQCPMAQPTTFPMGFLLCLSQSVFLPLSLSQTLWGRRLYIRSHASA